MKYVRRFTPVSPWDVPGVESWLSDQAARGLRLKTFRPLFCTFVRCPPEQRRYRVEACRRSLNEGAPSSMADLYREFGWDCVCDLHPNLLLFTTNDPDAPEPHSEPELQAESWTRVLRSHTIHCLFYILFLLLLAVLFLLQAVQGRFLHALLLDSNGFLLCLALPLFTLILLPDALRDRSRIRAMVRQLRAGIPLNHETVYPGRLGTVGTFTLCVLFLAATLILNFPPISSSLSNARPISSLTDFAPLRLAALEPSLPADLGEDGVDYSNFARKERSAPLCRQNWTVVQTGAISPELWQRLEIHWYDLVFSPFAVPLAREEFESVRRLDKDIWWKAENSPGWSADYYKVGDADFLAVAHCQDGAFQVAAAARGSRIAVVRYTGTGDLSEHLEEIVAMVQQGQPQDSSGSRK